jgi:hypothetical protein
LKIHDMEDDVGNSIGTKVDINVPLEKS